MLQDVTKFVYHNVLALFRLPNQAKGKLGNDHTDDQ